MDNRRRNGLFVQMAKSCLEDVDVWTPTPLFLLSIKKIKPLNSIPHTWVPMGSAAICNSRTFLWCGAGLRWRRGAHSFFSPYHLAAVQNEDFFFPFNLHKAAHCVPQSLQQSTRCTQDAYTPWYRAGGQWLFGTGGSASKAARGRSASTSHCANSRVATKLLHLFKNVSSVF